MDANKGLMLYWLQQPTRIYISNNLYEGKARMSLKELSRKKPLLVSIALTIAALIFRLIDIFILRLDELLGEIILSKTIGFILVVLFLMLIRKNLKSIGYNTKNLHSVVLFGLVTPIIFLAISYLFEILVNTTNAQGIILTAVDPKAGVNGGYWFGVFLIIGNVVNCFMEESLFRGVMIPLLRTKYKLWTAILIQAFIFGLWHIPWALKGFMTGSIEVGGALIMAILMQFAPTLIGGLAYGAMFYYTNSIITPWIAHFIINSVLNLIHSQYSVGLDEGIVFRMSLFLVLLIATIPFMAAYSKKKQIIKDLSWGQQHNN